MLERRYDGGRAYAQSKLAQIATGLELADELAGSGVTVTSLHPGTYVPTKKNGMVSNHYERLGFEAVSVDPESKASVWTLDVTAYRPGNRHIKILESVHR